MRQLRILLVLVATGLLFSGGVDASPKYDPLLDSIFRVHVFVGDQLMGGGTATFSDAGLLTNHHVAEPIGADISTIDMYGNETYIGKGRGEVIGPRGLKLEILGWVQLDQTDVVRLDVGATPRHWRPLKWAKVPKKGAELRACGFYSAAGQGRGKLSVGHGYCQGTEELEMPRGYWFKGTVLMSSCPICPGMSGGATLDQYGRLVGINAFTTGSSTWGHSGSWRLP